MEAHIEGSSDIYRAERKGGICKHCRQDGDRLIVFFDNHNFSEGRLLLELTIEYPDPDYSEDGIRQEHFVEATPVQVVADNGDALDLRLPEPKVVERVVERIVEVEKPVEKIVEKVVEKVVDNSTYTDLQKKAAEWVSRLIDENYYGEQDEDREKTMNALDGIFKFVNFYGLNSVSLNLSDYGGSLFNDVNSSDEDFKSRLELARLLIDGRGRDNTSNLFSYLNAPELDLIIYIGVVSDVSLNSLFYASTLNTITINAESTDFNVNDANSLGEKLDLSKRLCMFLNCTAKKVNIISSNIMNANYGWYILPSIEGSNVECFDFSGGGKTKNETFRIDNIIEKFLPDVTGDNHKPSIIFRDYTGEATEELKQKVLNKGYVSVEFYINDTKVL